MDKIGLYNNKLDYYKKIKNKNKINKYEYKIDVIKIHSLLNNHNLDGGGFVEKKPYFNKMANSIEFIDPKSITNNYKYKTIPIDVLQKITKINYIKMTKFLEETNYNSSKHIIHLSTTQINEIRDTYKEKKSWLAQYTGSNLYHNPIGLWVSCGSSWQRLAKFEELTPSQWTLATYIYEIKINDSVKQIKTVHELKEFIFKYKKSDDKIKVYDVMDWKKIKKEYDGLLICPYLGNKIWGNHANKFGIYGDNKSISLYFEKLLSIKKWKRNFLVLAEWLRHWESATGVIWRSSGIKDISLVKKLNTFDNFDKYDK